MFRSSRQACDALRCFVSKLGTIRKLSRMVQKMQNTSQKTTSCSSESWIMIHLELPLKLVQEAANNLFRCIPLRHCSTSMAHLRAPGEPQNETMGIPRCSWIFQACYAGMQGKSMFDIEVDMQICRDYIGNANHAFLTCRILQNPAGDTLTLATLTRSQPDLQWNQETSGYTL